MSSYIVYMYIYIRCIYLANCQKLWCNHSLNWPNNGTLPFVTRFDSVLNALWRWTHNLQMGDGQYRGPLCSGTQVLQILLVPHPHPYLSYYACPQIRFLQALVQDSVYNWQKIWWGIKSGELQTTCQKAKFKSTPNLLAKLNAYLLYVCERTFVNKAWHSSA